MPCMSSEAWTRASSASMSARTVNMGGWPALHCPKTRAAVLPRKACGGSGTIFVMMNFLFCR